MAGLIWPTTIPSRVLHSSYNEELGESTLKSDMDAGPPKMRPRSNAEPDTCSGTIVMTTAQTRLLDTFYFETTRRGAVMFTWRHQRTGRDSLCQFNSPPRYRKYGKDWLVAIDWLVHTR